MIAVLPEPSPLPILENKPKDLSLHHSKIVAIIKSQMVKVVNGQNTDFDKELEDSIESIWQDGYSRGLKDMDKMHSL